MQNLLYKLRVFMYGRNGVDGFGIFLFVMYFIFKNAGLYSRNGFLNLLSLLLLVFLIYRIFSKNLTQRQKENRFFMKYYMKIYNWFRDKTNLAKERARIRPTHKIYLCPKCKRKLKVPKNKGKIEISCPCGNKFFKRT